MRVMVDAMATVAYGCSTSDLKPHPPGLGLARGGRARPIKASSLVGRTRVSGASTVVSIQNFDTPSSPQSLYTTWKSLIEALAATTRGSSPSLRRITVDGWMLPETLRLADYDLGHDERAKQSQPVASCLGPRFYDWQLAQSTDESWRSATCTPAICLALKSTSG